MNMKRLNLMIAAGLVAIGIFIGVALACMVYITAAVAEDVPIAHSAEEDFSIR